LPLQQPVTHIKEEDQSFSPRPIHWLVHVGVCSNDWYRLTTALVGWEWLWQYEPSTTAQKELSHMIEIGTRVKLKIANGQKSPLVDLLNTLEGEVIKHTVEADITGVIHCVAFELEHMPAIQKARNEEAGTKHDCQLPIVGLNRFLGRPKDARFWHTVYADELTPA